MLIEFSVGNYLSFKDRQTISLAASSITEFPNNLIQQSGRQFLKGAAVFGGNASGKTNIIKAMAFVKNFFQNSYNISLLDRPIEVKPFLLNANNKNKPSFFELVFLAEENIYRYGFEVDSNKVCSEWLFLTRVKSESKIFIRDGQNFSFGPKLSKSKIEPEKIRPNALLLSRLALEGQPIAEIILQWFKRFRIISSINDESCHNFTSDQVNNNKVFKKKVLNFLRQADFNVSDILIDTQSYQSLDNIPAQFKRVVEGILPSKTDTFKATFKSIAFTHDRYNESGQVVDTVNFDLENLESAGTRKFFNLIGPIIDCLESGNVLVIDEIDSQLHPELVNFIVKLFNSKKNKQQAQLIFNTHNIPLLNAGILRRDQIWFVNKNYLGESSLYSLVDFISESGQKIRKDESFEKNYLAGRYGGLPYIKND
ncbi:MAG TPA: ATP-binding protein [bacterium]|nr:ATP-binding protein [bacterium]